MIRVAGSDPGTSSFDLLALEDGLVLAQTSIPADRLRADPDEPVRWLREQGPFDLIAGPSGYGLPLRRAKDCRQADLDLMTLVRPDERQRAQGVIGFSAVLRSLWTSGLPIVFLPGVIHLPTVPAWRKRNRIDLGTPDKLCVAALALHLLAAAEGGDCERCRFCLVELGSAFSAVLVVDAGKIVDGVGGSSGPVGWASPGCWDGELAYLLGPLRKQDLFAGGGPEGLREAIVKTVAGLQAVTPFDRIVVAGKLRASQPIVVEKIEADLSRLGRVSRPGSLSGATVKHAAQGAALIADGLAGGACAGLVTSLALEQAAGSVLDHIVHPRGADVRRLFDGE